MGKRKGLALVVSLELQTQATGSKINASESNTSDSLSLLKVITLELNARASFPCAKERKCHVWCQQQNYFNQIRSSLLAEDKACCDPYNKLLVHLASYSTVSQLKVPH